MVLMDGEVKCDNIFSPIIEKDQMVEAGTKVLKSPFNTDIPASSGIIIRLSGNAAWTASCIREHSENPPTIRIIGPRMTYQ
jgi:hypothetical protein